MSVGASDVQSAHVSPAHLRTTGGRRVARLGTALNEEGIAVRAGHHCAQPILRRFGLEATVRPSLAFYNTCAEIDLVVAALHRLAHRAARSR